MIDTFSAIDFIAATVSRTAEPLSSPSLTPLDAICSIWRLLSAFCEIEAFICSMFEVVSCTLAACSLVPRDRLCVVADTWPEADARLAAPVRTSDTTSSSFASMVPSASATWPTSSLRLRSTRVDRSPAAMRSAVRARLMSGRAMLWLSHNPRPMASSTDTMARMRRTGVCDRRSSARSFC